ncbi:tetratricopeptide repeat protein [Clostridium cylindrosporum]|uniref:TPR repeats containing protein n=1 Tax=Clostridium cylindrosporum DSM 605 TaxID=1121307 RepID=A0A0J8G4M3_CLOCY|nr:tetratricopeptide repeat protein [Clostridium cylindrosporum]KMT22621.1 TPR repeats containing protein [Clostridium cylindrosporum DSM 605]
MNYNTYLKREIEKALFIEIGRDVPLNIGSSEVVLKKGEYPILPKDMIKMAEGNEKGSGGGIQLPVLIDGMIYLVGCDKEFKYFKLYKEFLKNAKGMISYIIKNIEANKDSDMKSSLIHLNTLCEIEPKKEYLYNRVVHLMNMLEKTSLEFLEEEILKSLERLSEEYEDFPMPFYHLGEYYINKDMDKAKVYLRKCLDYDETRLDAADLLDRIKSVEDYDSAIDLVKEGRGEEALKTLYNITDSQPENLDAKYYLCVALRQSNHNHKALMMLKELSDSIERQEVYAEIALNLAALSEFEAAIDYFRKALKIMPNDSGIICNIGVCQLNIGEIDEAEKTFSLASRINKNDEIALQWLDYIKNLQ